MKKLTEIELGAVSGAKNVDLTAYFKEVGKVVGGAVGSFVGSLPGVFGGAERGKDVPPGVHLPAL